MSASDPYLAAPQRASCAVSERGHDASRRSDVCCLTGWRVGAMLGTRLVAGLNRPTISPVITAAAAISETIATRAARRASGGRFKGSPSRSERAMPVTVRVPVTAACPA